jgi:hypothetical protein
MSDEENAKGGTAAEVAPLMMGEEKSELKPYQKLVTSKSVYNMSLWAMRFAVLADSINSTILRPNYPFMVLPGAEPVRVVHHALLVLGRRLSVFFIVPTSHCSSRARLALAAYRIPSPAPNPLASPRLSTFSP